MDSILAEAYWPLWQQGVQSLLASNGIRAGNFRFTRPAPDIYEQQWFWDSAFHAIVYRWFDLEMARDELISVAAHQLESGPDAGMIPHMTYWRGGGRQLWRSDAHSLITQPPLLAVAARLVYERSGDRGLLETLYPRLQRYHDWFAARRDPDGDELVCIIHPWESWDASPRWDTLLELEPFSHEKGKQARLVLAERIQRYGCDAATLTEMGSFSVEAVDINSIRAADLEALAFIAGEVEGAAAAANWLARAQAVQAAVREKMIASGAYDLAGMEETPLAVASASSFIALFGGCASTKQAEELVARLRHDDYWTPFPVPTTPTSAPAYAPDIYWRGNVWMPVNWLIYMGLRRYGYEEMARELAARCLRLVAKSGFSEYYHPVTGEGYGPDRQSWTGLVLDMLAQEQGRGR